MLLLAEGACSLDEKWLLASVKAQKILLLLQQSDFTQSQLLTVVRGNPNSLIKTLDKLSQETMITITTKSTFPFTKNIALTPLGRECALTIDNARSALAGHLPRERQNLLVYLVRLLGRVNGRTRLMKLLFLLQKEYGIVNVSYKFIPYRFGPYSDEVLEDIHELICRSILIEKDIVYKTDDGTSLNLKSYSLSSVGDQAAKRISLGLPRVVKNNFSALRNDYGTMPLRQLLEYTYDKYPEFATESQIRQDVRNPRRYSFSDFCDDRVMCA